MPPSSGGAMDARPYGLVVMAWIGGLLLLPSQAARAQEASSETRSIALVYDAPARCPTRQVFEELVAARLGRNPFVADARDIAHVRVVGSGRALSASLEVVNADGTLVGRRALEGTRVRCEPLVDALAVALGILLEDWPASAPTAAPPEPVVPTPSVVDEVETEVPEEEVVDTEPLHLSPVIVRRTPTEEESTQGPDIALRIALGPSGNVGLLPNVSVGGSLMLGLDVDAFAVRLGAEAFFMPSPAELRGEPSLDAFYVGGLLALCGTMAPIEACAVGGLGAFDAVVRSVAMPAHQTSLIGSVGARVSAHIDLTEAIALEPWIEARGLVARTAIVIDMQTVWEMPPVMGSLGINLSLRWR